MKKSFYVSLFFAYCLFPTLLFSQTWNALGTGSSGGNVFALKEWNNILYIGGGLEVNSVQYYSGICTFDGVNYDSLKTGLDGYAQSFTEYNNILYVGGSFFSADNVPNSASVAGWNGTTWSTGNNFADGYDVFALASYNGELYAGGRFIDMGFNPSADRIARWNGSAWNSVGGGITGFMPHITCMSIYNGKLYVGGDISSAGGKPAYYIARWDGSQWDSVGTGLNSMPYAMLVDTITNILYVGGGFTSAGGQTAFGIAKWNDTTWTSLATNTDTLWGTKSLAIFNGELYAGGGNMTITAQGDTLNNIYKFDGMKWVSPIGGGVNGTINAMEIYNGNLYAGGYFTKAGTTGYLSSGGTMTANHFVCYGNTCPQGVGIQEFNVQSLKFKVYPNPSKGNIIIETEESENFILYIKNALGQTVSEKAFRKKTEVDVSAFGKGLFWVEVCDENGIKCHTQKVLVGQ